MPKPYLNRFTVGIDATVSSGQAIAGEDASARLGPAGDALAGAGGTVDEARRPGTDDRPADRGADRIIVVAGVQGSRPPGRDRRRLRMRQDLASIFRAGAEALGRTLDDLEPTEREAGLRLVVSPEVVSPGDLLDVFLVTVSGALRDHAKAPGTVAPLRLSVAVHFGPVRRTRDGWSGEPLSHAAGLAEAADVRRRLQDSEDACMALTVTNDFHRAIVGSGYAHAGPTEYDRLNVAEETSSHAWVRLI